MPFASNSLGPLCQRASCRLPAPWNAENRGRPIDSCVIKPQKHLYRGDKRKRKNMCAIDSFIARTIATCNPKLCRAFPLSTIDMVCRAKLGELSGQRERERCQIPHSHFENQRTPQSHGSMHLMPVVDVVNAEDNQFKGVLV
eukprot:1279034-Amphidinium_carterae.1